MNGFDFSPLFRSTIGFDRLARLLDAATRVDSAGSVAKITAGHNQTLAAVVQAAIWNSPSIKMA